MKELQALNILKQGIDISVSAGVYKSTEDVLHLHNALLTLSEYLQPKTISEGESIKELPMEIDK